MAAPGTLNWIVVDVAASQAVPAARTYASLISYGANLYLFGEDRTPRRCLAPCAEAVMPLCCSLLTRCSLCAVVVQAATVNPKVVSTTCMSSTRSRAAGDSCPTWAMYRRSAAAQRQHSDPNDSEGLARRCH